MDPNSGQSLSSPSTCQGPGAVRAELAEGGEVPKVKAGRIGG